MNTKSSSNKYLLTQGNYLQSLKSCFTFNLAAHMYNFVYWLMVGLSNSASPRTTRSTLEITLCSAASSQDYSYITHYDTGLYE